jgi:hypothetical protein
LPDRHCSIVDSSLSWYNTGPYKKFAGAAFAHNKRNPSQPWFRFRRLSSHDAIGRKLLLQSEGKISGSAAIAKTGPWE